MPYKGDLANAEFPVNINKFCKVKGDSSIKHFSLSEGCMIATTVATVLILILEGYPADEE